MTNLVKQLEEAKKVLLAKFNTMPKYVVTLGSGLSNLLEEITIEAEIPYEEIPYVKKPTQKDHKGKFVVGTWNGVRVGCMKGRLHYYEGHSLSEVVFPFRALAFSGSEVFVLTNAAGGMDPNMSPLDLVLITDHINLFGSNPLIGPNEDILGERFPDTTHLYRKDLREKILLAAKNSNIPLKQGIYVGLHGPSFETPAEVRLYRQMGGDVVGMSTVPEAIALHHMKKKVVGISCVTNMAAGIIDEQVDHEEVMKNAQKAYGNFSKLIGQSIVLFEKGNS